MIEGARASFTSGWVVAPSDPEAPVEKLPEDGSPFAKGFLIAMPLSGLLWWGLVLLWRALA